MKNVFIAMFLLAVVATGSFGYASYNYDVQRSVTADATTVISLSGIGTALSVWIKNDSATRDVWVNWNGRATDEVTLTAEGASMLLKAGEGQARDIQVTSIKLRGVNGTVEVRSAFTI